MKNLENILLTLLIFVPTIAIAETMVAQPKSAVPRRWTYQSSAADLQKASGKLQELLSKVNIKNPLTAIQSLPQMKDELVALSKLLAQILQAEVDGLQNQMDLLRDEIIAIKQQCCVDCTTQATQTS